MFSVVLKLWIALVLTSPTLSRYFLTRLSFDPPLQVLFFVRILEQSSELVL
jgi:hypothetical protein